MADVARLGQDRAMAASTIREDLRAGARAVAPMLVGVVPFGLVAGATPVTHGLGAAAAVGFSTIVFAGASQLAAIDVLGSGGSAWVAALAAWTINLRLLLYSASLVFLVLLIPALNGRPAAIAAAVGGFAAVGAAEVGVGKLSLMVGAVSGIIAGTLAELRWPGADFLEPEPSG